jgi:hypothetical protein
MVDCSVMSAPADQGIDHESDENGHSREEDIVEAENLTAARTMAKTGVKQHRVAVTVPIIPVAKRVLFRICSSRLFGRNRPCARRKAALASFQSQALSARLPRNPRLGRG